MLWRIKNKINYFLVVKLGLTWNSFDLGFEFVYVENNLNTLVKNLD
jgi:hypothetical protein